MRILIDMDDVLEELTEPWCNALNESFGTSVKPTDITEWDMKKFFPTLSSDQIYSPLHKESFWETVRARYDAIIYLPKLMSDGHELYVVTSSNKDTIKYKYEHIIQKYFPYIKWSNMIICKNKQMVMGDYLVDDGIHNLVGGTYKGILFTAHHNKSINAGEHSVHRCNCWRDVYNYITKEGTHNE